MIIIGMGALARADGAAMLGKARKIAESYGVVTKEWNGFNVLHNAAARVGGLDLGFLPARGGMDIASMGKAAKAGKAAKPGPAEQTKLAKPAKKTRHQAAARCPSGCGRR